MSAWSDFVDSVESLGTAGVEAYATYKDAVSEPAAAKPVTAPASGTPTWLMPALIGGGLLVLVLVFVGMGRK